MKYYIAQSTATDGTHVRWSTRRPSTPALDYLHNSTMPTATQLGNIKLTLFSDSNRLKDRKTKIWSESESNGVKTIYPTLFGASEDSTFVSEVTAPNVVKLVVRDDLPYTKLVIGPEEPSLFIGVL